MNKDILVVIGAGYIGQAIARRVGTGKHVLVANHTQAASDTAAETLAGVFQGSCRFSVFPMRPVERLYPLFPD